MKSFIITFLSFCLVFLANAQKKYPVYVSAWVNKPSQEYFSKPLIFLDFWATWCGPCIGSMSHTEVLTKEFGSDVLFLYLSNEPSAKVREFMVKRTKTFFSAIDSTGNNISNFKVASLPKSVLLDYRGKIIWTGNPTDMNRKILGKFVKSNKGKQGRKNRILKISSKQKKVNWKTFNFKSVEIKYREEKDATNSYSRENINEYYFSGDIKYLISMAFEIPNSQIISQMKSDKKYILSCKADDFETFKKALRKFTANECNIDISIKKQKEKVFVLEDTGNENFFSSSIYNFEKGDNIYLANERTIMIDNATIEQMTIILSGFSDFNFIYDGKNKNKYDWNIHYKYNNFTIDQLAGELGFKVTEEEKKLDYYYITRSSK